MQNDIMISANGLAPRYIDECVKCGKVMLKKQMATLCIREDGYKPVRTLCHICHDCLPCMLDEWGVEMP